MNKVIEIKFDYVNWWGYKIYRTKLGTPIVNNGYGFYSLTDNSDIDSDPDKMIKNDCIEIVEEFSN